jgi:hypothetical protein
MSTQRERRTQELNDLLETFTTPGFKLYHEECHGLQANLLATATSDCDTSERWFERRGRLLMLEQIIMYPQAAMVELQNIDDAEFDDESGGNPGNSLEE